MNFRRPLRATMAHCLMSGLYACSDGVRLDSSTGDVPGAGELPVDGGGNPTPGPVPLSGLAPHDTGFRDAHFSGSGQCSTCHDDLKDEAGTEVSMAGEGGFFDSNSRLFDHTMEGVSCTLCHQIEDDPRLGSREMVSGNFRIARVDNLSDRPAYGPYSDPGGVYMQATVFPGRISPGTLSSAPIPSCRPYCWNFRMNWVSQPIRRNCRRRSSAIAVFWLKLPPCRSSQPKFQAMNS